MPLKFIQIVTGAWRSNAAQLNTNVYGLTKSGEVYRYVQSKGGWVPLSMKSAGGETPLVSQPKGKVAKTEEEPW